jgi:type II secretory pathway component PulJ
MKRPSSSHSDVRRTRRVRQRHTACAGYCAGYTLIEILVATTLALLVLGAVITIFGDVAQSIAESRSMLEAAEQLRLAAARLQQDLAGTTATANPPRNPANNEGYIECIEGPVGTSNGMVAPSSVARNTDNGSNADTTVGDFDDILMFTTRSTGRPFVGKCGGNTIQSDVAEVAWFVRGRTLHRRVLLVAPGAFATAPAASYYTNYDVSAHLSGGNLVPNTLGDLTRRECRFAHTGSFPYDVGNAWYWKVTSPSPYTFPTLPTLSECSFNGWTSSLSSTGALATRTNLDFWTNNASYRVADNALSAGSTGTRVADDVILNNVIGFDVKVWDPDVGAYVDLGYTGTGRFSGTYASNNRWAVDRRTASNDLRYPTYDTWSTHYETAGTSLGDTGAGRATNGLDDDSNGIVDDANENLTSPPYPYPLRGIQVKIRIFEPDSRQIREVTVVQDFLPQ